MASMTEADDRRRTQNVPASILGLIQSVAIHHFEALPCAGHICMTACAANLAVIVLPVKQVLMACINRDLCII